MARPEPIVCRRDGCNSTYRGHAATDTELAQQARAAGWRLGTRGDGTPDAICPKDARPAERTPDEWLDDVATRHED